VRFLAENADSVGVAVELPPHRGLATASDFSRRGGETQPLFLAGLSWMRRIATLVPTTERAAAFSAFPAVLI
jgi:hypothetical protein